MAVIFEQEDAFVGKLISKTGDTLLVKLYQGIINGTWNVALDGANEEMMKTVSVNNINEKHLFHLTKNGKLPNNIKSLLESKL